MWYVRAKVAGVIGILAWMTLTQYMSGDAAFAYALLFTLLVVLPLLRLVFKGS